ncbi:MAG: hypothetical protein HDS99_00960 [Bacteroidales bacterium]|nr:hypothetical protein [Bacteroidales bacterium]
MKKYHFYLLSLLMLLLTACASEEVKIEDLAPATTSSDLRSIDEAVIIAKDMYSLRSNSRETVDVADVAVIGSSASRSSNDTLIYAINFADNKGFTLVSAVKAGNAVIGYTDEGVFSEQSASENPAFSFYLDAAKDYVSGLGGSIGGPIIDPSTPTLRTEYVSPRIKVSWGQYYPEGTQVRNKIAGCVQTSSAMVLSYFQPSTIKMTSKGNSTETLDWSRIMKHVKSLNFHDDISAFNHDVECEGRFDGHSYLASICAEIGYRNNAVYTNSEYTTSDASKAPNTLKELTSAKQITAYTSWQAPFTDLFKKLKEDCLAFVLAKYNDGGITREHTWICDGGQDYITTSKALSYTGEWITREEHEVYYHFNWGCCGYDNGYFLAGVFDTEKPKSRTSYNNVQYFLIYK